MLTCHPYPCMRRRQVAATCQVTLPASAGNGTSGPLQGTDSQCYDRAVAAINDGGACFGATPSSCSDACKAELQSFPVTDACWAALISDPVVSLLGEDYL